MALLTDIASAAASETAVSEESLKSIWDSISGLSLKTILKVIILFIILVILIRLVNKLFGRMLEKSNIDKNAHGFLRAIVRVACWFIAAMILAGNMNIDVSSLIAVLSVACLALSLAVQGALSNVAGGIVILFAKPFRVGDYVMIGEQEGFVAEINMTYTKLNTHAHKVVSIPNSNITTTDVINYSTAGHRIVQLEVCVDYASDIDATKEAFRKAVLAVPELRDSDEIMTRITAYKDNGIEYTIRAWCRNEDYWDAYFNLVESVKRSLDEDGIALTYTNLNVHIVQ